MRIDHFVNVGPTAPPAEVDIGARNPAPATFSIGDLANEFGVTLRTLRFYEDCGLLNPRRDGQNRLYSRRDRARLKLILLGKRVGFSLAEIRQMLAAYELRGAQAWQLEAALEKFRTWIAELTRRRSDVEQALDELSHTVEVVAGMLAHRLETDAPREAAE
jgi:DNA-binding transcriptional MerR regulator